MKIGSLDQKIWQKKQKKLPIFLKIPFFDQKSSLWSILVNTCPN